jgi:hypothetical protein
VNLRALALLYSVNHRLPNRIFTSALHSSYLFQSKKYITPAIPQPPSKAAEAQNITGKAQDVIGTALEKNLECSQFRTVGRPLRESLVTVECCAVC